MKVLRVESVFRSMFEARLEEELKRAEAKLTSTLTRFNQLTRGVESLEKIGVEKVCKLSTFIDEREKTRLQHRQA